MYSFYGGRPGNSFIIITTYRSIADMVAKFKQGPNYTAVHYDEHVMINTVNKNDPDNGKVYRRGYDFTNTMGGAEYIGTIVGPAGKAPMLEMTTVADVKSKHASEGYDERFSSGQYSPTGGNLVPGKTKSGTFNDAITWECCSIRNENDEDATAYIGFTFPYTVIDYETSNVEPYVSGRYADISSATRVDDENHPFYEKWHINVPKGVKGDAIKNFKVEAASSSVQDYTGKADDVNHGRKILAYDYYKYDTYQNGEPVRMYLGDYNMIDNVTIDDEGTITIDYSHDDDSVLTKKIKWVKSVTLNTKTGLFTVVYNHTTDASGNPTTYTTYLDWIDEVNVADDGTVTFGHTHEADTVFDKKIQWITGVTINNDGTVTFKWNNGTADTVFGNIIKWISSVNLAADGTLTVGYNNGAADSVFSKAVKWITDVKIADDGTVTVSYNNDDPSSVVSKRLKWINDITLTDNGTLTVSYNNGSADTVFANRIKWLTGATLANNGTFTLSWNNGVADTIYANLFKWISGMSVAANGTVTFTWNNGDSNTVYENLMKWISRCAINTELNTGDGEGTGNQKFHITWNDGREEDVGNPINYIMNMTVDENNHLLARYSDPARRAAGGITYNNIDGWTDLGQITQQQANYNSIKKDAAIDRNAFNYAYTLLQAELRDVQERLDKLSVKVAGAQEILQDQIDKISAQGAGAHNSIYRGKNLGTSVTDKQWAAIHAGRFEDLYIGDYWTIGGVNWRIAAFDYWLHCGDTECTTHHVVIVPDSCLYNAQLNTKNDTTGGYVAVKTRGVLATAENTIKAAFGTSHILSHRVYLTNAVSNGKPSGCAWVDTICDLMNEEMVYGTGIIRPASDARNERVEKSQLPLFAHEPSRISNRAHYWLRDVVDAIHFAMVSDTGYAAIGSTSVEVNGIRPVFSIKS